MFKFLSKKALRSPIFIIFIIVTSLFLFSEFNAYFQVFPIEKQEDLIKLSSVGGAADFSKDLSLHDEKTQLGIIKKFYSDYIGSDNDLRVEEKKIIQEEILTIENLDEFYIGYGELFYLAADNNTYEKHERNYNHLINFSGESYQDINNRIDKSLENHDISYYFAMRFADRLVVIWSLCLFMFITYRYTMLNKKSIKDMVYSKRFNSMTYVLENIGVELFCISLVTFIQLMIFGLLFHNHIAAIYSSNMIDYLLVYLTIIFPSLLVIITFVNLLYYIFESPVIAFPIYFIVESLASKVTDRGFEINKTNFIIRYDTLFESFNVAEQNDLIINRVLMVFLSFVFVWIMTWVFENRRLGKYKLVLSIGDIKFGKKNKTI